jgi:putative ribosome biogenesis GTPase RsgA
MRAARRSPGSVAAPKNNSKKGIIIGSSGVGKSTNGLDSIAVRETNCIYADVLTWTIWDSDLPLEWPIWQ